MKLVCRILRRRLCPTNGKRDLESLRSANNLPSFVGHKRGQRKRKANEGIVGGNIFLITKADKKQCLSAFLV